MSKFDKILEEFEIDKSNWVLTSFGDVAIQQKENIDREKTELKKYVKGEHMGSEDLHLRSWGELDEEYLGPAFIRGFDKGDVLYGSRRTYLRKVVIAPFSGITSNTTFVIKANEDNIDKSLLPFIMLSEAFTENSIKNSKGSVNPYINWKDISKYEFLLPPKNQQKKLAKLLWVIDEMIERYLFELDKQKILFLSYSQSIFEDGEGKYKELKDVGELIMGQSPPGSTYNDKGHGMAFLQGNAEFGKINPNNIKFTTAPNKIVKKDTILISVRAPVGDLNIANMDYCIGRGLAGLYIEDSHLRDYVYNFLKFARSQFNKNSAGSTFKAINKNDLSSIGLVIPSDHSLADNSQKINAIIDLKEKIELSIESSKSLKKSLINQIF
jgi:type I restriction enzyme, S subunit